MLYYSALPTVSLFLYTVISAAVAHEHHLLPNRPQLWTRQVDTSICLNDTGDCAQSNTIGDQCLSIIGLDQVNLENNDTPQNAAKVRDCICNGNYWNHLYACNSCLTSNNIYPTDLNPDSTPLPTLSSSYCSPAAGKSAIETIDGFVDPVTQDVSGYDVHAITTGNSQAISSQAITGGGAGRVTPSPDVASTSAASGGVSPYLNHSGNSTVTGASQSSSSVMSTSSGSASFSSTSASAGSTTASASSPAPSSSATSPSAASATASAGSRDTASFPLSLTIVFAGLFTSRCLRL